MFYGCALALCCEDAGAELMWNGLEGGVGRPGEITTTSWVISGAMKCCLDPLPGRASSEKTIREPLRWSCTSTLLWEKNKSFISLPGITVSIHLSIHFPYCFILHRVAGLETIPVFWDTARWRHPKQQGSHTHMHACTHSHLLQGQFIVSKSPMQNIFGLRGKTTQTRGERANSTDSAGTAVRWQCYPLSWITASKETYAWHSVLFSRTGSEGLDS